MNTQDEQCGGGRTGPLRRANISSVFLLTVLLMLDIFFYGFIVPLSGTYLTSIITSYFDLSPFYEIILLIFLVQLGVFTVFSFEARYWKHLFIQDVGYLLILQIRDFINILVLIYIIHDLYEAIKAIVSDSQMKPKYLGEGVSFVLLEFMNTQSGIELISSKIGLKGTPEKFYCKYWNMAVPSNSKADEEQCQMIHGAQLILAIASLTATIAKVIYFNTLFAILRAIDIFLKIESEPHEDDEISEKTSEEAGLDTTSEYISDFSIPAISSDKRTRSVKARTHYTIKQGTDAGLTMK